MKTTIIIILGIITTVCTVLVLIWVFPFLSPNIDGKLNKLNCKDTKDAFQESFRVFVVSKLRDPENHMIETIEYIDGNKNGELLIFRNDRSGAFDYIMPKDSIIKQGKDLRVIVLRDTLRMNFILDYGCKQ